MVKKKLVNLHYLRCFPKVHQFEFGEVVNLHYLRPFSHTVKLTSMQLVGEFVTAISVHLEAILKLENMDYCGKRLSESAVLLI